MQVRRIVFVLASVAIELCLAAPQHQQQQQQHRNNEVVAVDNQARNFRTSATGEYRFEDPGTLGKNGHKFKAHYQLASILSSNPFDVV